MTTTPHAHDVSGLQHFLLDVARRYVVAPGLFYVHYDDLLASAAALDYVLLLCREHDLDVPTPSDAVLAGVQETIGRGVDCALDAIDFVVHAPEPQFRDFSERHAGGHGIFPVLGRLRTDGAVPDDLAFRAVTLANDVAARGARLA